MTDIGEFMKRQEKDSAERTFRIAMANARNAMHVVKIAIEEGDTDEALRLIDEALGADPATLHSQDIPTKDVRSMFEARMQQSSRYKPDLMKWVDGRYEFDLMESTYRGFQLGIEEVLLEISR